MSKLKRNTRMLQSKHDGFNRIRIFHRKGVRKQSPRYLLKCGCCDQQVEIFYDAETLEINGVLGSIENWREILNPLLGYPQNQ